MTGGAQVPRGDLRLRAELRAALQTDADWAAAFARLSTDRPELLRNARALSVQCLKGCSAGWVANGRMGGAWGPFCGSRRTGGVQMFTLQGA